MKTYSLSIVDFRNKPCHLFNDSNLTFSEITTILSDFFIAWEEAFTSQSHKNKSIGELNQTGLLGYTSFYLNSIGVEEVHYCDVDENLHCFHKHIPDVNFPTMFVTKHQVIISPQNDYKKGHFRVVIHNELEQRKD
jgi:hypothetical protein